MKVINPAMRQANRTPAEEEEEVLWIEILNALKSGSELHEAAFAQLQGSPEPFEAAIAVLAVLPEGTFDLY
jgi:hypothetical protein